MNCCPACRPHRHRLAWRSGFAWLCARRAGAQSLFFWTGKRARRAAWGLGLLGLVLGALGFFILGSIPFLGLLTLFVAGVWGLGTVIATRFGSAEGWQLMEPPEETETTNGTEAAPND